MIVPPIPVANVAGLLAAQAIAAKVKPYAPVGFQTGGQTWFEGSGAFPLSDAASWGQVWDRHVQNEAFGNAGTIGNLNPAPDVDFQKDTVLALFGGPTRGVVGYRFVMGYEIGRQAVMRLVPLVDGSRGAQVAVPSPWAFLVLPRTKAVVSIQMPRNGAWSTVATVKPTL